MKTKSIVRALATAAWFSSSIAHASSYQGTLTNVTPYNSLVFLGVSGGGFDGGASSCFANATSMVYSFDPSTAQGKAILAAALSAKLTGRLVYIYGNAVCPGAGNPYNGQGSENMIGIDLKG